MGSDKQNAVMTISEGAIDVTVEEVQTICGMSPSCHTVSDLT